MEELVATVCDPKIDFVSRCVPVCICAYVCVVILAFLVFFLSLRFQSSAQGRGHSHGPWGSDPSGDPPH